MKNMITANKQAFQHLIKQILENYEFTISEGKRYIKTDAQDKRWLQETRCDEVYQLLPNIRSLKLNFDTEHYFALLGVKIDNSDIDPDVLEPIEINAGLITILLSEQLINLEPKFDGLAFFDEVLSQHDDPLYSGHDYLDIVRYLEPIQLYKVPDDSLLHDCDSARISTYIFTKDRNQLFLEFNKDVLEAISNIAILGSKNISFSLVLSSLLSTSFKHAFLELYRLIERLFPVSFLKDFHVKVKTKMSFLEFTATMEDSTGWWPKEIDAVETIFNSTQPSVKKCFEDFLASSSDLSKQIDFKYFYKLRNSIVHFRANHQETALSTGQWNLLLLATVRLIDEQYNINDKFLA